MKTVKLSNKSESWIEALEEACKILNNEASEQQTFDVYDDDTIIEYDFSEQETPIGWEMDKVIWNDDGTAREVHLDC